MEAEVYGNCDVGGVIWEPIAGYDAMGVPIRGANIGKFY